MSEPTPVRRRRRLVPAVVALLVVALPVGGFLAYGAWTRSGEIVYDRGGEVFGADASSAPVVDAPAVPVIDTGEGAAATAAPTDPAATAAAPTGDRPAVGHAGNQGEAGEPDKRTGGHAAPGTTARAARPDIAAAAPTQPVPGTYGLTVSGSEKVTFGPFSFCGRDLPKSTSLVISPAQNEPTGSYNFDVRYFPGDAGKHDERHIYRYVDGGIDRTFESATVTCSGVRQGSDISFSPAQRCVIAPLKVGATWSGTGGDADRMEKYTTTVADRATVEIAGRDVPVFVIDTRTTFTGSEAGERTRRWWYAPSLAMPVKWTDTTSGGRSGAKYSNEITVTVSSLPDAATEVLETGGR